MKNTRIAWCDHTFNPWIGCTRISCGCDNCYAAPLAHRFHLAEWGDRPRVRTSETYWRQPIHWNKSAQRQHTRFRVFAASMGDVFDNQADPDWRRDLWALIAETPHLDWLLLTKRPQNIASMLPGNPFERYLGIDLPTWPWPNVWLGCSVENQDEAHRRIPFLVSVEAAVHFVSGEPLLSHVDLTQWMVPGGVDWVIAGGESGPKRRPVDLNWLRSLRDQCVRADVPYFCKQIDKVRPIPDDLWVRQAPGLRSVPEAA